MKELSLTTKGNCVLQDFQKSCSVGHLSTVLLLTKPNEVMVKKQLIPKKVTIFVSKSITSEKVRKIKSHTSMTSILKIYWILIVYYAFHFFTLVSK